MGVSRSGYYKWKKREPSERDINRENIIAMVKAVHEEHRCHGYRWVAAFLKCNYDVKISDNYAYKCFRYLGIVSETKHKVHSKPRKERDKYPNLIFSTWETVDRPRQVIVSDMTSIKFWICYFEVTFYFDVFTKEILSWRLAERRGSREQYIGGLEDVVQMLRGCAEPTIIHTDQGSVYSSKAYNELIKDTNIVRSMSRAGKPTDNPVNESLNGWIKEELFIDFHISECRNRDDVYSTIERYVKYFNEQRPCYAIHYDTPVNFRKRFFGENCREKIPSKTESCRKSQNSLKNVVIQAFLEPCLLLKTKSTEKNLSCLLFKKLFPQKNDVCPLLKK